MNKTITNHHVLSIESDQHALQPQKKPTENNFIEYNPREDLLLIWRCMQMNNCILNRSCVFL